jgi:hypothetical protein
MMTDQWRVQAIRAVYLDMRVRLVAARDDRTIEITKGLGGVDLAV